MNIKEIQETKKRLISSSNPEWRKILDLRLEVKKDINDNKFLQPEWVKIIENSLQNLKRIMEEK